jgi:hypothetical protein
MLRNLYFWLAALTGLLAGTGALLLMLALLDALAALWNRRSPEAERHARFRAALAACRTARRQ